MRDTLEQAKIDGRAPWTDVEINTRYFVVYKDTFPVTKGHTLVVPKQNTIDNILKCYRFALEMGNTNVLSENTNITGYNVVTNIGESTGQSCMYPHIHLIFRRDGDTDEPLGGVRHCVTGKGHYIKE